MGNCCLKSTISVGDDEKEVKKREMDIPAGGSDGVGAEPPWLKEFTLAEMKIATGNFRENLLIGEGGFGRVFKGFIDEKSYEALTPEHGMPVAIKMSRPNGEQGLKEWKAEVDFLGKLKHSNLVKLLGYCWEENLFFLVYEFVDAGSLESHLFPHPGSGRECVSWDIRIKIAIGAARGLAFLHSTGEKKVIYRDFKASNILLDQEFNAKISDFGLAKLGPEIGNSHVTTQIVGTYGYAAPEYVATGKLYIKSDVYGFGVVLLEMLTGHRVHDPNRSGRQANLVEWARPLLLNKRNVKRVVDSRLDGQYRSKAASKMADLILNCIDPNPKSRPNMEEVLKALDEISEIKMKKAIIN